MATDSSFADAIVDLLDGAGQVSARRMFGEYGLYLDGKLIGLICDNRLLIKAPPSAADLVEGCAVELPFPGARKAYPVISEELWDDRELMLDLVRKTWAALPYPKPKANSKPTSSRGKGSV